MLGRWLIGTCILLLAACAPLESRAAAPSTPLFAAKVEVMVVSARSASDHGYRITAFDLSKKGLGAFSEREIPIRSSALLRFEVPPNRGTIVQVRAIVAYCRAVGTRRFQVGFEFERVGATQLQQLAAAVVALSQASAPEPGTALPVS